MGEHYPPEYEPYQSYEVKKNSWLMQKAVDYGLDNRARGVMNYKKSGLLLDLGCAAGDFLIHIQKKYGWQVRGVEISNYASAIAREQLGLDVFTGNLQAASFPDNTFDAVTMWDVLEHLHDPTATLREIHRVMKPGGILALRVPNGDSYDARIFGSYWSGLDAPRHLYVYSRSTLRALLEKNGFEVLRMTSKHGSYLGFVLSIRMLVVSKGMKPAMRDALIAAMYHPLARMASAPLFYLYSLLQNSSQLMVSTRVKK
jgi:ubiquinone/menaquinone biosynthesis C-methylase UbiE